MKPERFRWIAAVVYAHPNHKVVGRTRLQKTMRLLQQLGLPVDYDFRMHYYGPYSDGIQSDINLLQRMRLVHEEVQVSQDTSRPYSIFTAGEDAKMDALEGFRDAIQRMDSEEAVVLELAATYDAFYEKVNNEERALSLLRRMKKDKCTEERMTRAFQLLSDLKLATAPTGAA